MTESNLSLCGTARRWRFYLLRGARRLEVGDFLGAQRHFAAAYREAPEEPIVCLAWGRERLRLGDAAAAEQLLRRAWTADPSLTAAGLELARVLSLHRGRVSDALALIDQVEKLGGPSPASLLARAEIVVGEPGRHEEARTLLERARALGADSEAVRLGLARAFNAEGLLCGEQGEYHQALFALKRAVDLDPDWSSPLVNSGAIFDRLGQWPRARAHYRTALRLDPQNPVALFNLADSLCRHGELAEAERLLRRLLSVQPEYPDAKARLRDVLAQRSLETRPGDFPHGAPRHP